MVGIDLASDWSAGGVDAMVLPDTIFPRDTWAVARVGCRPLAMLSTWFRWWRFVGLDVGPFLIELTFGGGNILLY